ncbi:family 16 glycoside hydrolase [Thalassoroseus pseudoceratinae]|uniref:family 16 glycoside hydrolase n=1 Tax=Thalassoroseus pseudoceratinae TaxID=2713176 RepID=UPI0014241B60|nr:family 16 glycoside hydrolase [Thalassoroseus pseudoceratinae]
MHEPYQFALAILVTFGCNSLWQSNLQAESGQGTTLIQDDFNRDEKDPTKEQVGNGWGTNSRTRAKGHKQVDLVDGAMHIKRAEVADHGVSVTHEAAFKDAIIKLRFKLGPKDNLGINIADMKEKSVHAGHICMAKIHPGRLELVDLKTGRMNEAVRTRRLAAESTPQDKELLKKTVKFSKLKFSKDEWHQLQVQIIGDEITVMIDDKKVGAFQSPGIGHATKSRLRLAVGREAWVDDVEVIKLK